jgi:hypothetical protein
VARAKVRALAMVDRVSVRVVDPEIVHDCFSQHQLVPSSFGNGHVIKAEASRLGSGLPNVRAGPKPRGSRAFGSARLGPLGPGFGQLTAFCRAEHSTSLRMLWCKRAPQTPYLYLDDLKQGMEK